jgi:hypothetical protein
MSLEILQDLRQREGCEEYFCKFVEFIKNNIGVRELQTAKKK